jgi:3D (Asp-Asp-Asp) domain-containing protein
MIKTRTFTTKGTGYYPPPTEGYSSPQEALMEGGPVDRMGLPLCTLQAFLAGEVDYVSVAMDVKAFAYGTQLIVPELNALYKREIPFRVVDTGGAFKTKGTTKMDICVANRIESYSANINKMLTVIALERDAQ